MFRWVNGRDPRQYGLDFGLWTRRIVALLIEVGQGRLAPSAVASLVEAPGRVLHGRAAPARGLTLERVIYESNVNEHRVAEGES